MGIFVSNDLVTLCGPVWLFKSRPAAAASKLNASSSLDNFVLCWSTARLGSSGQGWNFKPKFCRKSSDDDVTRRQPESGERPSCVVVTLLFSFHLFSVLFWSLSVKKSRQVSSGQPGSVLSVDFQGLELPLDSQSGAGNPPKLVSVWANEAQSLSSTNFLEPWRDLSTTSS